MRGLVATLSVLSALASFAVALAYLVRPAFAPSRQLSLILWATTLTVGVIAGAAARKLAARERAGLARSTLALFVGVVSLVVGVIAFVVS